MKTPISRRVRWTGVLAASALILAGCADTSSDDGGDVSAPGSVDYSTRMINANEASGDPVTGGTLRVSEYSEARTLDPTTTYPTGSTGGNIEAAVYDTLMRYDHESDTFVPQLAESLETDDNITWTLKLREGVKFHDGTPFDADAVVASINRYINTYGLHAMLTKSQIKKLEAVDPQTVQIEMQSAWPRFPNVLTSGVGMILAPAAYKDPQSFKPIGAGPFKFESYKPAETTKVVANEDYWDGRPYLDAIEFNILGTDRTGYESLQSGGVDVSFVRGTELADEVLKGDLPAMDNYASMANNLWFNTREGSPTADKRVRQALALAFDPKIFLDRTANGAGDPSKLLIGADSAWAPGVDPMPTDTEAAKKLVEEAKADGFDGKVRVLARTDQASQAGAVAMQGMFEAVGFDVKLDLVANVADQVQKIYVDHDFDIATAATSMHDEAVFARLTSALGSTSAVNVGGYANPEMDKLISELQAIEDPTDAKEVLTKIEALWAEDAPGVAINSGAMLNVWNENVHGIKPSGETIVLFDKAWIQK
ncbi:ABC transporter substrate-binding protein [Nocardioides sp. JQ2195]|uniref:ABC transporter substrate-binding protein n=1 Tax=Nocardioides sp. JQ2195 TaxID=2592334 RepID=UPI00143EA120|nr:ABC transporter substrate-binding protein [Nocardioides sp. JQ2195]QIX25640.1 ABC transporter substrate-binding protein [Nocardioides sp. JQ2195]